MNKYLKAILSILVLVLLFVAQKYSPLLSSSNEEEKVTSSVVEEERVPENQSSKANDSPNGIILPIMGEQDGVLIEHEGFTLLFDTKTMCPRWVAWELTAEETRGKVSRSGVDFKPDDQVPEQYQVASWDYNGGHYGRGHMCPAGDMKWSQQAMQDCHYMTNICPQTAELNKTWWEHLERACRSWARQDGSVQIVCGPVFSDNPKSFGKKHRMAVPKGFYKVVLSLKEGKEKAIGFYYTNNRDRQTMEYAKRTVDEIEDITGMDFFYNLPDELEERVESRCNLREWN